MNLNIKKLMATNFKYYNVPRSYPLDSIEIHSIGTAQDEAEVIGRYMNQYSPGGIVHAIVDAKEAGKVVELLPWDNLAWADAGYGNQHSYAIEIAESDQMTYYPNSAEYRVDNQAVFKADVYRGYNTAVVYVAKKCMEFGFDPMDKLPNGLHRVYSHQEANKKGLASAHVDPAHIWSRFGLNMNEFRQDVSNTIKSFQEPVYETGKRYRMTTSLSIRTEPRADAPLVMYNSIPATKRRYFRKGSKGEALIKKGVADKCLGEHQVGKRGIYMRIIRGWILAQYQGKDRVKEV